MTPDGVLLLDKPSGISSNAALQRVRRIFGRVKAGHTGSLDPLASGLLPICLGRATRFSGFGLDAAKGYRVTARLGARTDTGDAEGEIVERGPWETVTEDALRQALNGFRGCIQQVPPMYSALKQGGERLYRKARRGETVERPPRPVEIFRLELTAFRPPEFSLEVDCSKGTYVRTLVEDVARAAGSCAHVTVLRRFAVGPFRESDLQSLEVLEALAEQEGPGAVAARLLPPDALLGDLPGVFLPEAEAARIQQGQPASVPTGGTQGMVRIYGPAGFLGVGRQEAGGRVLPRRMMAAPAGA
ncbi:MAG: tRNA pseudouridine(55) synthase TruB [Gammaproteobacteria bacterium]